MRRIDLICKLIGPLFIALINGVSTEVAIIVNFSMNVASVVVEYTNIARVCPASRFHNHRHHSDVLLLGLLRSSSTATAQDEARRRAR